MKIILASWGLSTEPIIKTCEELVGKPRNDINIAIINEAMKGEAGDHRWFAEELNLLAKTIGGKMEFVDLQSHPLDYVKERIAVADMIFCFGGYTDYLANIFTKTGFDKILPEILAEKVWVGSSAGSCILCHKESEETQKEIYQETRETERFMDIVPVVFLPHLHGFCKFDQPEIIRASEQTDLPVYAMSDKSALIIEDGKDPAVVGEDYIIAKNGVIEKIG